MTIASTFSALESQLSTFSPYYAEIDRAELLPFETPGDIVRALRSSPSSSSLKAHERYALVTALVAEHQKRPHSLWAAVLLLAFAPMIQRLRLDLGRAKDEERDQRVIFAFLEALKTIKPVGSYVAIALRRGTRKALFANAKEPAGNVSFDEEEHSGWDPLATTEAERRIDAAWAARRLARTAAEHERARPTFRNLPRKTRESEVAA